MENFVSLKELIKLGAQTQPLGSEGNSDFDETRLRPIVIDGSNVAMRFVHVSVPSGTDIIFILFLHNYNYLYYFFQPWKQRSIFMSRY